MVSFSFFPTRLFCLKGNSINIKVALPIGLPVAAFFLMHAFYLGFTKFSYGYNMKVNLTIGKQYFEFLLSLYIFSPLWCKRNATTYFLVCWGMNRNYAETTEAMTSVAMVLALMPLQKFLKACKICQWKCLLQIESGLTLLKMKFQAWIRAVIIFA